MYKRQVVDRYGNIESYLKACGLTEGQILSLHDRLVGPAGDYRHLPLEGAYNYRELGGYPCSRGYTQFHRLMRSDGISQLSPQDLDRLYAYGLRTIVDLRFEQEAAMSPDATLRDRRFCTLSLPYVTGSMREMGADATTIRREDAMEAAPKMTLADIYVGLVQDHDLTRQVLEAIAHAQGGVLFHCCAGKDRTLSLIHIYKPPIRSAEPSNLSSIKEMISAALSSIVVKFLSLPVWPSNIGIMTRKSF